MFVQGTGNMALCERQPNPRPTTLPKPLNFPLALHRPTPSVSPPEPLAMTHFNTPYHRVGTSHCFFLIWSGGTVDELYSCAPSVSLPLIRNLLPAHFFTTSILQNERPSSPPDAQGTAFSASSQFNSPTAIHNMLFFEKSIPTHLPYNSPRRRPASPRCRRPWRRCRPRPWVRRAWKYFTSFQTEHISSHIPFF